MHKVEWESTKINKLINVKTSMVDGERKVQRKYAPTDMVYPMVKADTFEDLVAALREVAESGKTGFRSVRQLLDHVNYGLFNGPATQLRRGQDPSLSQAQRDGLKMYAALVKSGMCDLVVAVEALTRQGVQEAESQILALNDSED